MRATLATTSPSEYLRRRPTEDRCEGSRVRVDLCDRLPAVDGNKIEYATQQRQGRWPGFELGIVAGFVLEPNREAVRTHVVGNRGPDVVDVHEDPTERW